MTDNANETASPQSSSGGVGLTIRIFVLGSSRLISSFGSIAVAAILSRYLSVTNYGLYRQVWLIYNASLPLFLLGLSDGMLFMTPRLERSRRSQLLLSGFMLGALLGAGFAFYLFIGGARILVSADSYGSITPYLGLFGWYCATTVPIAFLPSFFIAIRRSVTVASFVLVDALIQLLSVLVPIGLGWGTLESIFTFFALFASIKLLIWVGYCVWIFRKSSWRFDHTLIGELLSFAVPVGLANVMQGLTRQAQGIIVSLLFTAADFAIYSNAVFRLPFIGLVTRSAMSVLLPEISRLNSEDENADAALLWRNTVTRVASIIFPLFVVLFVFAGVLTTTLFSVKYTESTLLFRIWLLEMPLRVSHYGNILVALGRKRLITIGSVIQLILFFVFGYIGGIRWGLVGVVSAGTIAAYILPIYYYLTACHIMGVPPQSGFDWGQLGRTGLVALAAGIMSASIYSFDWPGPVTLVAGSLLFVLLYGAMALYWGIISKEEITVLFSTVRNRIGKRFKKKSS